MTDLIDEFFNIVKPYCDSPDSYIEAGGYFLVSDLLGRFFRTAQMPSGWEGGRPNFWFIMSSISGRMRRSTIQKYTDYTLKRALMRYYRSKNIRPPIAETDEWGELDDDEKDELTKDYYLRIVDDTTIEEGTPEGLADAIQAAYTEHAVNVFRITSTEFGGVLRRARSKEYFTGVFTLLSKLRYGEGGSMYLSRRGKPGVRRIPPGLYVTLYSGMQEPRYYLDIAMIRQGTARRILIDFIERNPNWLPPLRIDRENVWPKLNTFADKLGDLMIEYERVASSQLDPHLIDITFIPDVFDKINALSKYLDKALDDNPSNVNIFRQSLWEHLAQICMLRRIAEARLENFKGLPIANIGQKHFEIAKKFISPFMKSAETIIDSLGVREQKVLTQDTAVERVYRYIYQTKDKGIARGELYRKLGNVKSKELDEFVDALSQQGQIEKKVEMGKKKSERVRYWAIEFFGEGHY